MEEHLRLLYVAMTRAADRLIVSGVMPKAKNDGSDPRPTNSWHVIVEQAMTSIGEPGDGHVSLRYGSEAGARSTRRKDRVELPAAAVPDWAKQPAPPEARPPRPLAPSAIAVDDEGALPPSEKMRAAALRGTWIHQLLERLPDVEESGRPAAADRWLERSAGVSDSAARAEIVAQVCGILSNPQFSALFGPGSLAEAPLAATLPDGRVIAGTADRLLIDDERVLVLDFKTGKAPAAETGIPNPHRAQMTAYAEALQVIFPDRRVSASLLYTAGPKLIELMP
jgi:ATP-dependent helicase/nuclease subunit A